LRSVRRGTCRGTWLRSDIWNAVSKRGKPPQRGAVRRRWVEHPIGAAIVPDAETNPTEKHFWDDPAPDAPAAHAKLGGSRLEHGDETRPEGAV